MALGEKSRASPTWRCTIFLKSDSGLFSASSTSVFWPSISAFLLFLEANGLSEAPAMWFCRTRSHSGDVNRWTIVTEHKLSSTGEIVGSCVETITRVARCRWSLTTDTRVFVNAWASSDASMYLPLWSAYWFGMQKCRRITNLMCFIQGNHTSNVGPLFQEYAKAYVEQWARCFGWYTRTRKIDYRQTSGLEILASVQRENDTKGFSYHRLPCRASLWAIVVLPRHRDLTLWHKTLQCI